MIQTLQALQQKQEVVSLYSNPDDTRKFAVGYLLTVTEEELLMAHIAPDGGYDGYSVYKTDAVYALSWGDAYSRRMKELYERQAAVDRSWVIPGEAMESLLRYALEHRRAVTGELLYSGWDDFCGLITAFDGNTVHLHQLDEDGLDDGEWLMRREDISWLGCDDGKRRTLMRLHEARTASEGGDTP